MQTLAPVTGLMERLNNCHGLSVKNWRLSFFQFLSFWPCSPHFLPSTGIYRIFDLSDCGLMYAPHQYTLNIIAKPSMGIHLRLVLRICAIQLALRVQVPTSREFVHGLFASAGTPNLLLIWHFWNEFCLVEGHIWACWTFYVHVSETITTA